MLLASKGHRSAATLLVNYSQAAAREMEGALMRALGSAEQHLQL